MMQKDFEKFISVNKEQKVPKQTYKPTNLVHEVCVSMTLFNNTFLDNILDKGLKHRYTENTSVFMTDLKNLLLAKNRLRMGMFRDGKCVEDSDAGPKINGLFESVDFDIEKDWNKLVNARNTARSIIDKLLPDGKLTEDMVVAVYWIGPNKDTENKEDIVVELTDGRQYSFYLNKNLSASKSSSFNAFATDLLGEQADRLKSDEYLPKWNKLAQQWVKIMYEMSNKNMRAHIEKFVEPERIESMTYFQYFDLKHRDPRFKHLGEYIRELDTNVLYLSDLLSGMWKNRDTCFFDPQAVYRKWMETKVFILNSRILEHFLTTSLTKTNLSDIKKLPSGYKMALGKVKMKLVKAMVEKLGCAERPVYYLSSGGSNFIQVPPRSFFRDHYKDIKVKFDYHVKLSVEDVEEENDFVMDVKLYLDKQILAGFSMVVKFSGKEMSERLTAKYSFVLPEDFNYKVARKMSED